MLKNNIILTLIVILLGILVIFVCRKDNKEKFKDVATKQKFLIDQLHLD